MMCFCCWGSHCRQNLVTATLIGFVDSIGGSVVVLAEHMVFLTRHFAFLAGQDLLSVWRWSCEFPDGEYSFPTPHEEEAILVAMCLSQNNEVLPNTLPEIMPYLFLPIFCCSVWQYSSHP